VNNAATASVSEKSLTDFYILITAPLRLPMINFVPSIQTSVTGDLYPESGVIKGHFSP
jgi:hypothetical protein